MNSFLRKHTKIYPLVYIVCFKVFSKSLLGRIYILLRSSLRKGWEAFTISVHLLSCWYLIVTGKKRLLLRLGWLRNMRAGRGKWRWRKTVRIWRSVIVHTIHVFSNLLHWWWLHWESAIRSCTNDWHGGCGQTLRIWNIIWDSRILNVVSNAWSGGSLFIMSRNQI